jgi:hypothetical protein
MCLSSANGLHSTCRSHNALPSAALVPLGPVIKRKGKSKSASRNLIRSRAWGLWHKEKRNAKYNFFPLTLYPQALVKAIPDQTPK